MQYSTRSERQLLMCPSRMTFVHCAIISSHLPQSTNISISSCSSSIPPNTMQAFISSPIAPSFPRHCLSLCERVPCTHRVSARLISLPTGLDMEVIDLPPYPLQSTQSLYSSTPSPARSSKHSILFVHGSLHGAWCYHFFQPFFAEKGYQTFAISLRGAGMSRSEEEETSITVEQHILDLNALMDKLNLPQPPIIVAHSMGGFIVQKWVEQGALNPPKMVLVASTPPDGLSKVLFRSLFKLGIRKSITLTLGFARRLCATDVNVCREMFYSQEDTPGFLEEYEGDEKLREYMSLLQLTKKNLDRNSLRSIVKDTGSLHGNVLVIGGELDCLVDGKGVEETAHFWGAQPYVFPNAPHNLILYSRWKDVAEYVNEWLKTSLPSKTMSGATGCSR